MVTVTFAVCVFAILVLNAAGDKGLNADAYLEKYGYIDGVARRSGNPHLRAAAKTKAIKAFQAFAHLPVTGELDDQTKEKMLAPRCGMADVSNKKTRASYASKWDKSLITWKLVKTTPQMDAGRVRKAIHDAFAVWSSVIPLNFTEVSGYSPADMQFDFGAADHGDSYHFDGRGGVLAHAFYPKDGRLHFDEDEKWTFENAAQIKDGGYTDLLSVTIHEMGHALGLPHLKEEEAIMFPFYRHPELDKNGQIKQFVLSNFDIMAIQEAYGPREGGPRPTQPPTTPQPTPPGGPSTGASCPRFQATVTGPDGATYFFDGSTGWRKANGPQGAPNSATRFYLNIRFPNGPSAVTAAVTDKGASRTYLLQGRRVWGYDWESRTGLFTPRDGFPKDLQNDVPFTPEGAFQLNGGHLILFSVQSDQFVIWEPSENKAMFNNKLSNYFGNFPTKTSFNYEDKLYFIDDKQYTVYDVDDKKAVNQAPLKHLITC